MPLYYRKRYHIVPSEAVESEILAQPNNSVGVRKRSHLGKYLVEEPKPSSDYKKPLVREFCLRLENLQVAVLHLFAPDCIKSVLYAQKVPKIELFIS